MKNINDILTQLKVMNCLLAQKELVKLSFYFLKYISFALCESEKNSNFLSEN